MIDLFFSHPNLEAGQLVLAALQRSVSKTQVSWKRSLLDGFSKSNIFVAINPSEALGRQLLLQMQDENSKLIVFGSLPECIIHHFEATVMNWPENFDKSSRSLQAEPYSFAESDASIRYRSVANPLNSDGWSRPFERFDFSDEWNNLGYGAIRGDQSIWGLSQPLKVNAAHEIAGVYSGDDGWGSYSALFDTAGSSLLWFNRSVGPIDSFEWRLIEYFLASYRAEVLPCQPVLYEIPWGYDAAITMRLDCDEDVESARPLWEAYKKMGVPFSLAVNTINLNNKSNHKILIDMASSGESILSHTATHAPNWGGSYESALNEGRQSKEDLGKVLGHSVKYAVSPFHQTPNYALWGLMDAGYNGVIGGIIRNDPEFLLARGGELAGLAEGFIGHSQQCMLHGECMLANGDSLGIYKKAFDKAVETKTLFGYLDHPFSDRYHYGWENEQERIAQHQNFIGYMRLRAKKPLFISENDALDFLRLKSGSSILETNVGYQMFSSLDWGMQYSLAVEYRDTLHEAKIGAIFE